ncbi:MAG: DUF1775 domain-containing protein [Acidimicrobiales bacterium]|nr:DUF1775 domain-containing protein [Acidimicrobiales bacterium]
MSRRALPWAGAVVGAGALLVALAAPAAAHVHPSPSQIPAGETTTVGLGISHGCDDSPTTEVAVQLPDGLDGASAVARSGWAVETADGTATWTARPGNELASDEEAEFEIELTPADEAEGDTLFLKTVQTCEEGELRWIAEWDGEGEEPDNPAPSVTVLAVGAEASSGDHHAEEGGDEHAGDEEHGDHEEAAADGGSAADDASESDSGTIALVVLVIAAIGLGGVALVRARRSHP